MRCEIIRKRLLAGDGSGGERTEQHLAACAKCRTYAADLARLEAGFRTLAAEETPQPSWAFAERVLRRLAAEKARNSAPEFLEKAGRRVILATLVLVFALIMAMVIPSSGPVRRQPTAVAYWPQASTTSAANFPVNWSSAPALPALMEAQPVVYHEAR